MTRQEAGRKGLRGRCVRFSRAAGYCAAALSTVVLVACEQLSGGAVANSPRADASATRSARPDTTVRQAQVLLAKLGYDPGPADGLLGSRTVQAVREYQKAAGLPVDGKVNEQLMAGLKSGEPRKKQVRAEPPPREPPAASAPIPKQPLPIKDVFTADYGDIQPIYNLGDAFVWSSGYVDRVVRVGADNVVWRSTDGTGHTAFRSFAAPPIEWQTGSADGSAKISVEPSVTWPLDVGGKIEFEVDGTSRKLDEEAVTEVVETWSCARGDDKTIDVPAGRFETAVVSCTRKPVPDADWHVRVWYYAPAVRHYVRRDSFDAAGRRLRIRLVSLRPAWKDWPPAARAGLDWAIQDTLTKGEKGMGVEWGSSGVSTKLTILPGVEFTASGGRRCRKYALIQTQPMAPRIYPAISCWDPEKQKWLVPGLDESAAPVAAVR